MVKLVLCCFIAAVGTSFAAIDVERTVQQVQTILQGNSQLPRLSRDEILQLLNDIRAEDAKSASKEQSKEKLSTTYQSVEKEVVTESSESDRDEYNEVNPVTKFTDVEENYVVQNAGPIYPNIAETTTKAEPSVMVVLPYTPRDGSSLQELYTKPPRVEVVPESKITKPLPKGYRPKIQETLKTNSKIAEKAKKPDISAELQEFLNAHGLEGKPGQDHFLLPLDGFKPLPTARVVDGSIELPENILLMYDLIGPPSDSLSGNKQNIASSSMFEPLRPELPFELETSASHEYKSVLPLDLPKNRKTKSVSSTPSPNYEPIDYDSVKVIPLQQGPSPIDIEKVILENDLSKRQAENETNGATASAGIELSVGSSSDTKEATSTEATTEAPKDLTPVDSGASLTDLEESFGGVPPEMPGDSQLPPPKKNGFYWMLDWNSFLEVGDGDTKVNIRLEPKLGDPQMFLPVTVP